jgi:hypothetical protein
LAAVRSIFRKVPAPAEGIRAFAPVFAGYGRNPVFGPKAAKNRRIEIFNPACRPQQKEPAARGRNL